jgi:UDP-3-O-[3-hydroxymyristoyl] glucosamine N-acyltransferase
MAQTASEIARSLDGEVVGDGSILITGLAPADQAKAGHLTFAENESYLDRAEKSDASAILVGNDIKSSSKVLIRVTNPRVGFARLLNLFYPPPQFAPGVHPTAVVASSAQIDPTAHVGPHCAVGERVIIGARTALRGGNHLDADCVLGEDVLLHPHVTLYARCQIGHRVIIHANSVVGSDGFGFVFDQGAHRKVPQIGNVIIQDDVEIGAGVTIDRGALGSTVIGQGTKIDNLVQIGHNVLLGEHCILCGQVGIAGSTKVGQGVTIAGQVGLAGHLKIGNKVTIGAQAGVMNNIPDGEKWLGTPAMPDRDMKRIFIGMQRLPELLQRVNTLERKRKE